MRILMSLSIIVAISVGTASAAEIPVDSRIVSAGLFKNGLAVITRTLSVSKPGTYRVADVPEPVHGTFWVMSDAEVETRLTRRLVEVPADTTAGINLQEELAGRLVTVHFAGENIPPATGRVVSLPPARGHAAWDRTYQPAGYGYMGYGSAGQPVSHGRFLILQTDSGRAYVDTSKVAHLQAEAAGDKVKRLKPVLLFEVGKLNRKPATIRISYLAKGLSWAPSYRVDISDKKRLALHQKAVIKNELADLQGTRLELISGFPNIEFSHVTSPLSLRTTLQDYFTQLSTPPASPGHASMGNVVTQQAVSFNRPAARRGLDLSAIPTGDGIDLHYQDIGRHDLAEGESLAVRTARASAPYERIVDWVVPNARGDYGQYIHGHVRSSDPDRYDDTAWDAIRFRNPLEFPMTTAPAMIVDGERFNGQRTSYWVNRGEMTTLRVTKALSLRTRHTQQEVKGRRKDIYLGGDRYYRATVDGKLQVNNHRKEVVSMFIRRRFSGELKKADGKPSCRLEPEGVFSVNKRNECEWHIKVKPGQEINIDYRYTVLVRY